MLDIPFFLVFIRILDGLGLMSRRWLSTAPQLIPIQCLAKSATLEGERETIYDRTNWLNERDLGTPRLAVLDLVRRIHRTFVHSYFLPL